MGDGATARTRSSGDSSCAYLAFEVLEGSAHKVQILEMCDALTTSGVDTELLMFADGAEAVGAAELREYYGLDNTPQISWIPRDRGRWAARFRLIVESARASRTRTFAYTRRALAALGALLGGARHVFLEMHAPTLTRHDQLAFSLIRRSKRLHIVCISRRLAEIVARRYGFEESALIVEHNGSSYPIRYDYRVDSAAGRRLCAMYVGTFAPGRGLETIAELAERHPTVDFAIAGGTSPQQLPGNVSVLPRVRHADVSGLLARADILLMPYTRSEMLPDGSGAAEFCSPLKMFEYLSAGRSIIASNLPSIAEVLVDESNCLLADPDSVKEWSAALARLESDPTLRVSLARGAAETAERHTTVGRVRRILEQGGTAQ